LSKWTPGKGEYNYGSNTKLFKPKISGEADVPYNVNGGSDKIEDIIVKHSRVRCIIQCVGLWIASGNYMCQWKLVRAEVEVPESAGAETFLPDSDDEGEHGGSSAPTEPVPKMLEDSDESDAEADEPGTPEPEPVVAAPPKKARKVVKRKKTNN
jgi:hypothetical protein